MDAGNLEGLIPLIGGAVVLMMIYKKIPVKNDAFLEKHKKWLKPASIFVCFMGVMQLLGMM